MPKNHEGACGPCALCKKTRGKFNHFGMLHEHVKAILLTDHSTTLLSVSSCICYTCFKRCQHNKSIVCKSAISPKQCQLKHCERAFHSNWYLPSVSDVSVGASVSSVSGGASVSSVSEVEALLDERVTGFEVREGSTVIGLCREHYNKLYRLSSAVPECASVEQNRGGIH